MRGIARSLSLCPRRMQPARIPSPRATLLSRYAIADAPIVSQPPSPRLPLPIARCLCPRGASQGRTPSTRVMCAPREQRLTPKSTPDRGSPAGVMPRAASSLRSSPIGESNPNDRPLSPEGLRPSRASRPFNAPRRRTSHLPSPSLAPSFSPPLRTSHPSTAPAPVTRTRLATIRPISLAFAAVSVSNRVRSPQSVHRAPIAVDACSASRVRPVVIVHSCIRRPSDGVRLPTLPSGQRAFAPGVPDLREVSRPPRNSDSGRPCVPKPRAPRKA